MIARFLMDQMAYTDSEKKAKLREIRDIVVPIFDGITNELVYFEVKTEHYYWLLEQVWQSDMWDWDIAEPVCDMFTSELIYFQVKTDHYYWLLGQVNQSEIERTEGYREENKAKVWNVDDLIHGMEIPRSTRI